METEGGGPTGIKHTPPKLLTFCRSLPSRHASDMLLSDSEDESEQLQSDSQSDSESSLCSPDEDYIPKGLGRGSDE